MSIPFLNYMGRHNLAKMVMFATHCIATVFFGVIMGPVANVELIAVFLMGLSFLLFNTTWQRTSSMFIVILVLTILGIYYGYEGIRLLILSTVILLNMLVFYYSSEAIKKLEDDSRAKTLTFNNTNHETRNYLNVVAAISDELQQNVNGKSDIQIPVDRVRPLWIAVKRMALIINNVLDYATIDNGSFKVSNSNLNLRSWLDEILQSFQIIADEKEVVIELELADDLPEIIYADDREFMTVLSNLISNAIKFTKKGSVVGVKVRIKDSRLVFTVTDHGQGLSDYQQEIIFKPFVSQKNNLNRGTGLGLPLVKKTVEALGGNIQISSQIGKGSTFIVSLPFMPGKLEPVKTTDHFIKFNKTVLVIDDDLMNLRFVELLLQRMGCNAILSGDVEEGLQKTRDIKPDLILLDMELPGIGGKDALKQVAARMSETPVITVTGHFSIEKRNEMLSAGAVEFITKPLDFQSFYSKLAAVF
jgi:signal transduction histidine kinase